MPRFNWDMEGPEGLGNSCLCHGKSKPILSHTVMPHVQGTEYDMKGDPLGGFDLEVVLCLPAQDITSPEETSEGGPGFWFDVPGNRCP